MPPVKRKLRKLKDGPAKRLASAAYLKGYFDCLVGSGAVFVPGVGLVSGLLGQSGLEVPGVLRESFQDVSKRRVRLVRNISNGEPPTPSKKP